MKLDLDFIKEILLALEEQTGSRASLGSVMAALKIEASNESKLDILAGHIRLMRDAGFIESTAADCGIMSNINKPVAAIHTGAQYEITLPGYQMLDGLRNDNLMSKIKTYLSEIGISGLKKAPGFIIGLATQHMMKS